MSFKYNIVYQITNKINGKIYIGIHRTNDLNDGYLGSGKALKRSIRHYGKENFERVILFEFDDPRDMLAKEAELVNEEFVKRKDTYNLVLGGKSWTGGMVSVKDKDRNYLRVFKDDPRYLSGELVNTTTGMVSVKDKDGNTFLVSKDDLRYLSGELKGHMYGKISVKDSNGNTFVISKDDPRYLSGEYELANKDCNKNKVPVINVKGKVLLVYKDDPRYLSGELKHLSIGRKHTVETKEKMKMKHIGYKNSQYGTMWITNGKDNKKIKKNGSIPNGWNKGRTL